MGISRFDVALRGPILVTLVSAAAAVALSAADSSQTPRAVREQVVRVAVADRDYAPIKALTTTDFTVREGGVAREILKVEPVTAPLTAAILADDSQAAQAISAEIRPALRALAQGLLAGTPDSEVALTTFGERPTKVVDFTKLSAMLFPAIDRVFPRSGTGAYFLDAVLETTRGLARKETARPTIVGLVVENGPEFSSATRVQIETALKQGRVALWTLVLQSSSVGLTTEQRTRAEVTVEVAAASGGLARTVISPMGLEAAAKSMAAIVTNEYDVTYARPESMVPPKDRQVTCGRPGARVMASRWITP